MAVAQLTAVNDRAIPLVAVLFAVFGIAYLLPKAITAVRLAAIPTVGQELGDKEKRRQAYLAGARKLYNDGYKRFKNGVFRITTSRSSNIVVLSPKFLPELNKLPDHVLSMEAAVDEAMETKYTKIETSVPIIPHTVTGKLTPSLTRLNPMIAEEVKEVLEMEIPPSDEWKEVHIHHKLLRIVAMVSGRVFIGPEFCRSEKYLDAAINYTMEVMNAQRAVQRIRPWLRPFLAQKSPEIRQLYQRIDEADAFMRPLIKLRKDVMAHDLDVEKPDDMLQWLIDGQEKYTDANSQNLAKVQLGLSFAAIHTTTLTATNAFYNIAAMEDLVPELREEIKQALAESDGVFTSRALQSMKKLDSFLKETMRMNPATMASFQRKVLKPFTLSNGQHIPAGVTIEIPAVAVNSDPTIFSDPERFDALRFYRLRQQSKEAAALNQFVSVGPTNLSFGYGRHACPGRFFAANEIKMILASVLLRYDVKLVKGSSGRYPNIEFAHMSIPDPSKNLLFKTRVSTEKTTPRTTT
ncbi:Cytochrome P450 [Pleurostoma richardsiae]|uniref:Cytochrome P450 n=1 Tax=Pleurostoma richardsiae TaxID=41990 RepID=A0AA38VDN7_9PEZI|nr:Cytochrome P450 [Pleurostoma richardsiae]